MILSRDGIRTVVADRAFAAEAEALDAMPDDAIFAPETAEALLERLKPAAAARGCTAEISAAATYEIARPEDVNRSVILSSTRALTREDLFENLTDCEIDPYGMGLLCFGTVINGRILSAASENPSFGDVVDIGVETADGFENRGYGTSNAAMLAAALLENGNVVTYTVEGENPASGLVAEKVGFSLRERDFWIVFYYSEGK